MTEDALALEGDDVEFTVKGGIEGLIRVDGQEVSEETSGVGGCHRGTRECSGGCAASLVGGEDVQACHNMSSDARLRK